VTLYIYIYIIHSFHANEIYIYLSISTHTHTHTHIYIYESYTHTHACIYVCVRRERDLHTHIYVYMCVCLYNTHRFHANDGNGAPKLLFILMCIYIILQEAWSSLKDATYEVMFMYLYFRFWSITSVIYIYIWQLKRSFVTCQFAVVTWNFVFFIGFVL
jgi:hypothetical protein